MAEVVMESGLVDSIETVRAAHKLGVTPQHVAGGLYAVLSWFSVRVHGKRADGVTSDIVDDLAGLKGFSKVLESVGWLVVHRPNGGDKESAIELAGGWFRIRADCKNKPATDSGSRSPARNGETAHITSQSGYPEHSVSIAHVQYKSRAPSEAYDLNAVQERLAAMGCDTEAVVEFSTAAIDPRRMWSILDAAESGVRAGRIRNPGGWIRCRIRESSPRAGV